MARKPKENSGPTNSFPANAFWEELSRVREALGGDHLGADHRGRFETVALQVRHLPIDERLRRGDVPRELIASLVGMLNLDDPDPLVDRLWMIAGRHLRPVHRLLLGSDPKSTRADLQRISVLADRLCRYLDELPPVVEQYISDFSDQLPAGHIGKLDRPGNARDAVFQLSMLCAEASNQLIGVANRPPLSLRRQTLGDVVTAVEKHSRQKVEVRWSSGDRKVSDFKGLPGKFVWIFMHMIEPKASEAALANELKILRNASRKHRTP